MKKLISIILAISIFLIAGCDEKIADNDFVLPKNSPASALTIGWYTSPEVLKEIVGLGFEPKIVNDKNQSTIMLFIVKSDEHIVDGFSSGPMEAAHLVIPVVNKEPLKIVHGEEIENTLVCPITIVDQSQRLGNKYEEFGFATYTGEVELDVNYTGEKYLVDAKVTTANGLIEITSMFEEDGTSKEFSSAIFNSKPNISGYFFGNERMTRIGNGKGNLKVDGQNIISAMQLNGHPYYLKLDLDFTWEFDFAKE